MLYGHNKLCLRFLSIIIHKMLVIIFNLIRTTKGIILCVYGIVMLFSTLLKVATKIYFQSSLNTSHNLTIDVQGCPSTLGINRKPSEVVEKVPVKDKRLKPRIIGTSGSTIQGIEKDTGCRLKLEDNIAAGNGSFFVRISGSSRTLVGKAVDAVKKLIDNVQHERKPQGGPYRSYGSHKHGSNANALGSGQIQHIPNQPSHHEPSMQPYLGQDIPYYEDSQHGSVEQINQMDARRQRDAGNQNGSFAYGHKGGIDQSLCIRV